MAELAPYRLSTDSPQIPAILALLHQSFAYMEGRIDPPSSLHRLTADGISEQAKTGEVWAIGTPPTACMFLTVAHDHLYLGKLAVAESQRNRGLARALVKLATERARTHGMTRLVLKTRIELIENQRMFEAWGFRLIAKTSHPGYDRPTTCTYEMDIA